ncbi:hypothetical protein [Spirosoma flavus]
MTICRYVVNSLRSGPNGAVPAQGESLSDVISDRLDSLPIS